MGHIVGVKPWRGSSAPRIVSTVSRPDHYDFVRVEVGGRRVTMDAHCIVAEAFHGPRPATDAQVRHRNGDKHDNRASNLMWGTPLDNARDRVEHGTSPVGSLNPRAILDEGIVRQIKARLAEGESPTVIASEAGIPRAVVYDIRHGRRWTHVKMEEEQCGAGA